MTADHRLVDAIVASPEDDQPRLVYADRLKEQGDPRGGFIADQCALAGLDESDARWTPLHVASERTRRDHEATWVEPLAARLPSREVWAAMSRKFRRGFVEHLESHYTAIDWRVLSSLAEVTPLRSVMWRPNGEAPEQVADALAAATDAGLTGAVVQSSGSLRADAFDEVDPEVALRFTSFGVRSATVAPATVARLARLLSPALKSLTFGHTIIGDAGLVPLAGSGLLARLPHLDLRGNQIGQTGLRAMVSKRSDVPIELHLADNPLAIPYIDAILSWRPLRRLDLVGTLDRPSVDQLLASDAILDLASLALAPRQPWHFDVDRARTLAERPFRRLTRLTLGRCRIESAGMAALANSEALGQLVGFEAFGCQVGDKGVESLVTSPHLTRLVQLDLHSNGLTDAGLQALAAWPGLRNVVRLTLGQNYDVTAEGWRALLRADGFDPTHLGVIQGLKSANPGLWAALEERFGPHVVQQDGLRWPSPYPSPYPSLDHL